MEYRKVMDIIAYYLSEFDRQAFDEFGFETQSKGFREIAVLFRKKGSYLRRLRDEYDVITNSSRRGQCNRPPRPRIIQTTEYLKKFSFEELTDIVRALIENARLDGCVSEEFHQDGLTEVSNEEDFENILNFKDTRASIRLRTRDQRVRVYNTDIIKRLKQLYGGCCQLCGKNAFGEFNVDISEAHHIAYFSDSQNNDSSNIIILCPNHHRLIHKLNPKFDFERGCFVFSDNSELGIKFDFHLLK